MATPEQIANLRNHAAFVGKQENIDMLHYATNKHGNDVSPQNVHSCGTAMCAMGFSPTNKDLPPPITGENWDEYGLRIFGFEPMSLSGQCCFDTDLPNDPTIISKLMLEVADELEASQ